MTTGIASAIPTHNPVSTLAVLIQQFMPWVSSGQAGLSALGVVPLVVAFPTYCR